MLTKEELETFLMSDEETLNIPMAPLDSYSTLLQSIGFQEDDEIDTNSWSIDFSMYFNKGTDKLELDGSLYYGNWTLIKIK